MRALLVMLSAVLVFSACAKDVQLVEEAGSADPVVRTEKAIVELRLGDAELSTFADVETGVWDKAREIGLQKVFNKMLVKDTIFVPVDGMTPLDSLDGVYSQTGMVTQDRDAETGDLVQSFGVVARFVGDLSLGGEIVTVEESNYLAGGTDTVYAMLYNNVPPTLPAYVLIAEPVTEVGAGFYRVVGMGELIQTMGNTVSLPADKGGATGKLCSVEVVVSNREVEPGDMVFLMSVELTAFDPELPPPAETELDTVVVEPLHKDVVHAPKEQK